MIVETTATATTAGAVVIRMRRSAIGRLPLPLPPLILGDRLQFARVAEAQRIEKLIRVVRVGLSEGLDLDDDAPLVEQH